MAIGMLQSWEGFTKEMYDGVTEKMFGHMPMRDEAPDGLIVTAPATGRADGTSTTSGSHGKHSSAS
jgi:hypothetical protein